MSPKLAALLNSVDLLASVYTRKKRGQDEPYDPSLDWRATLNLIAKMDKLAKAVRKENAQ